MVDVIHHATAGAAVGPHRVVRWSPKDHAKFTLPSREVVRTLLLVSRRIASCRLLGGGDSGSRQGSAVDAGPAQAAVVLLPALPDEVWELVISLQCVVLGARPVEILAGTGAPLQPNSLSLSVFFSHTLGHCVGGRRMPQRADLISSVVVRCLRSAMAKTRLGIDPSVARDVHEHLVR
jgi:hypothetical protein